MRLIDADKLNAVLQNLAGHLAENGDALLAACLIQAQEVVDAQRTVEAEPVVRAKWVVKFDGPYGKRRTYCSNCQKRSGIGGTKQEPPRCPHCGAWMEKEATP